MSSAQLVSSRHAFTNVASRRFARPGQDFTRSACWDPVAECSMVMSTPAAEPRLFEEYHRGAVESYARFGVSEALDADVAQCADDTALFWVLTDSSGDVVGGVRAKGPLLCADDSHAVIEWAGQAGEAEVRRVIDDRVPAGVLEMKAAWLAQHPGSGRHRTRMIARSMFQAMAVLDVDYCMATAAAHILEQWRSSGGVVSDIPATPYPDARYETKMIWWDRRTFAIHGEADQVAAVFREMAQVRRSTRSRRVSEAVVQGGERSVAG